MSTLHSGGVLPAHVQASSSNNSLAVVARMLAQGKLPCAMPIRTFGTYFSSEPVTLLMLPQCDSNRPSMSPDT